MKKRVLKWDVQIDDHDHPIGAGKVVLVDCKDRKPDCIQVWTEEDREHPQMRAARVYGTGQPVPASSIHLGSSVVGPFVWHVYGGTNIYPEDTI